MGGGTGFSGGTGHRRNGGGYMTFLISQEFAQELLNYLATKPFQEVFQLINKLQQLKKAEEPEKPKE
jgi:hypothetical protein